MPSSIRIVLFISLIIMASCKPKEIQYLSLENIEIIKMGYPRSVVGITAVCYNPNSIGWTMESLDADLTVEGKHLGKVRMPKPLDIARKDTFQIPLELDIETLQSLKSLAKWIGKNKQLSETGIELNGSAAMKRNGLSFKYPISYKGSIPLND